MTSRYGNITCIFENGKHRCISTIGLQQSHSCRLTCVLISVFQIIDDSESETSEQFELRLAEPSIPAALGSLSKANVVIEGPNDGRYFLQ